MPISQIEFSYCTSFEGKSAMQNRGHSKNEIDKGKPVQWYFYWICTDMIINYWGETPGLGDRALNLVQQISQTSKHIKPLAKHIDVATKRFISNWYAHTNYLQAFLSLKYDIIRMITHRFALNYPKWLPPRSPSPWFRSKRGHPIRALLIKNSANHDASYQKSCILAAVESELPITALVKTIKVLTRYFHSDYCTPLLRTAYSTFSTAQVFNMHIEY